MRLPAICDNCGRIFPSLFELTTGAEVTLSNVGSGPCPRCGGVGSIPDGIYTVIDTTLGLLNDPKRTVSELEQLTGILRSAKQRQLTPLEVGQHIHRELPQLSLLSILLPKSRADLYAVITIIIAIITLVLSALKTDPTNVNITNVTNNITINNVIEKIYEQESSPSNTASPPSLEEKKAPKTPEKPSKIGRNNPCPCGSGKKYKKCCLNKK